MSSNMGNPEIQDQKTNKSKFFYGWWIALGSFIFMFLYVGLGRTMFFNLVADVTSEFNWDRGAVYLAVTVAGLAMGFGAPVVGRILDKKGPKNLLVLGALITAAGFFFLSAISELWMLWAGFFLVGVGMACIGQVPSSVLVNRWFMKKRGLATGLMTAGSGIGSVVISPLVGAYLLPEFGWRMVFVFSAILTLVTVIPIALFVIKGKPEDKGLYPDGAEGPAMDPRKAHHKGGKRPAGLNMKEAAKTPSFWFIALAFACYTFGFAGIQSQQVPMVLDLGISLAVASGALGVSGLFTAVGRFVFGWLCDYLPVKLVTVIGLLCQLVGILALRSLGPESPVYMLYVYSIAMGLGIGAFFPVMSLISVQTFGLATFGSIFGGMIIIQNTLGALSPTASATTFDLTGGYSTVFLYSAILTLIAVPLILLVKPLEQKKPEGHAGH